MMPSIPQLGILLVIIFLTVVPPILVLASGRAQGGAKYGWFIGAVFFSWIGYIAFVLANKKQA